MAFDYTNLYPDTSGNGGFTKSWNYTTLDSIATVSASGYFNKVATRIGIGDNIYISQVDAFDRTRTSLLGFAILYVSGISGGVVTTTTGYATPADLTAVSSASSAAIALKANIASPTFTGTPAAPTAAVDTNTTQLATTAMVLAQAAAATPLINGSAAVGTSTRFARADHVHPTDTTRQSATGTATSDSAAAGKLGEYIESIILSGSAVSITTATAKTVTSISLTAGDWDVSGLVGFLPANTTSVTQIVGSLSTTTNTLNSAPGNLVTLVSAAAVYNGTTQTNCPMPPIRFSLSATTSVFLVAQSTFTVSTNAAFGIIRARRVR